MRAILNYVTLRGNRFYLHAGMTRYEIHESGPVVTVPQLPPKYKPQMQRYIVEEEAPSEVPYDPSLGDEYVALLANSDGRRSTILDSVHVDTKADASFTFVDGGGDATGFDFKDTLVFPKTPYNIISPGVLDYDFGFQPSVRDKDKPMVIFSDDCARQRDLGLSSRFKGTTISLGSARRKAFCGTKGIILKTTPRNEPQANPKLERQWRTNGVGDSNGYADVEDAKKGRPMAIPGTLTGKIIEVRNVKFDESTRGIDASANERHWSFGEPPRHQPVQSVEKVGQTSREYRDILQQETEQTDEKIGVDSDFDASPVVSSAPLATTVPSATHDMAPRDIDGNVGEQNIIDGKRLEYEDDIYDNDDNDDEEANCVRWATRDDARRANIAPIHTGFVDAIKQNESTVRMRRQHLWPITGCFCCSAPSWLDYDFKKQDDPYAIWRPRKLVGDGMTMWLGNDGSSACICRQFYIATLV
eukprot:g36172.t1